MTEPIRKPNPPNFVPEEDLNLHENFAPAIAENGRIRQLSPDEIPADAFAWMDDPSTRFDTVQDLVAIRRAEKQEAQLAQQTPTQPVAQPLQQESPGVVQETNERATTAQPEVAAQPEVTDVPSVPALLPAKETATQNLPALPVLAAAGETTRLGKTRRKKKKRKTVRMPAVLSPQEKTAEKPGEVAPAGVPPQTPPDPTPARPKRRRWGWALLLLLLGFFIIVGGVVPVENIPVLRSIAHAMGFDKNTTRHISFLRALLAWTDKSLGLNGKVFPWPSADTLLAQGMKGANGGEDDSEFEMSWQASLERASGDTRLIDIRALNALQREQGRTLDGISGTVVAEPGREDETLAAVLRDDQVTARTEANIDKGEVFFGSDNSAVSRRFEDGYDSSKMLTKIKNPYITDGKPIDWTQRTAWQLMNAGGGLIGASKDLQYGAAIWQVTPDNIGNTKPHQDLYHAWITSRMAKYTTNIWLKKSLADSSFLNAEIPTTASTGLKMGGVMIDSDSLQEDQESWKEYMEYEEKCRKELTEGGGKEVSSAIDEFNNLFSSWPGSSAAQNFGFPEHCEEVVGSDVDPAVVAARRAQYSAHLNAILEQCRKANQAYDKLYTACNMRVRKGKCSGEFREQFNARWDTFTSVCAIPNTCEQQAAAAAQAGQSFDKEACNRAWQAAREAAEKDAQQTENKLIDTVGGAKDYFPQMIWGVTYDSDGNVTEWGGQENLDETMHLWFNENKANF